jgi:3-oxoadipate enol-lactonase
MTNEKLANGTIEARIEGAGPTLVLFHSLLADRSSFDGVIPELAKQFRVVVPALPGFGGSHRVEGGLVAVADRMADAVRDVASGEPVVLLGNGYGGFVALQMVIRHPDLVSRLVVADAGACFSEPGRAAFRGMAMGAAAKGLEGIADIAMRRLFAPDFHAANPDLVAERRAIFLQTDPEVVIAACEALASMDLRPEIPGISVPALVVVGAQDEATPVAMSRELAALLPNADLVVLDGLAHVPQLQDPAAFLAAIKA